MTMKKHTEEDRFFLGQDNDSHWYIVPADNRDEWEAFLDDDEADSVPDFAERLNGHPSQLTFERPEEE